MSNLEVEHFYQKINIYKNVLSNPKDLVKTLEEAESDPENSLLNGWREWYVFGKNLDTFNIHYSRDQKDREVNLRDARSENNPRHKKELKYFKEVIDAFYSVTEHYAKENNFEIPEDWFFMGPSFCKYFPDAGATDNLAMHYHSDYQLESIEAPGTKFAITCVMYLNDNYEGGEVDFLVNQKKNLVGWKPVEGEIMVFPAGNPNVLTDEDCGPYYHGVKLVHNGTKWMIRMNWVYWYNGSDAYNEGIEKYGEQLWTEMELERRTEERKKGLYHVEPPIDVERIK